MPHYAYRVHNVPGQILSQVPEDINKTLKNETFKESAGCKKSKVSVGCTKSKASTRCTKTGTKCSSKGTKGSSCRKITSLDELRMKYSK